MFCNIKIDSITALLCWSALFVYGCGNTTKSVDDNSPKPTMVSDNLTITRYEGGRMLYRFETPHAIRYQGVDTAYMIFDKGVYIVTYEDSTTDVKSWLKADYAIFYESIDKWEARDNVVAADNAGKTLYTDLLFWDKKTRMINSPIKTKVIDGEESVIGLDGFESDEGLVNIEFYNSKGRILVDTTANKPIEADTIPQSN